jgi:hypothetical protein
VRRCLPALSLTVLIGCSDPRIQPEAAPERIEVGSALNGVEGDQPTVMFSCEEGRVTAYAVTGPVDGAISAEQMVRIDLDSAPDC